MTTEADNLDTPAIDKKTAREIVASLVYGEIRQVNVFNLPGTKYLPCIPAHGETHTITELSNGTLLKYNGCHSVHGTASEEVFFLVFDVLEQFMPTRKLVWLAPDNIQYLWKARITMASKKRRHY